MENYNEEGFWKLISELLEQEGKQIRECSKMIDHISAALNGKAQSMIKEKRNASKHN